MPRHIYGELARCSEGVSILLQKNIIDDLLRTARNELISNAERTSALWSLGHLASVERTYNEITIIMPTFVEWCISNVLSSPNFALRGTYFHVLGLISRSKKGARKLASMNWSCTAKGSTSAVAVPRNPSQLFINDLVGNECESFDPSLAVPPHPLTNVQLNLFIQPGTASLETDLLNLISKVRVLSHQIAHFLFYHHDISISATWCYRNFQRFQSQN